MSSDTHVVTTESGGTSPTPAPPPAAPPVLSPVELARWGWRQLTSMRTALVLLFLLALAAVPGSIVPQANIDAIRLSNWKQAHPSLTPIYERLGLFSVYTSVWFSAVYLLLMVSLVGCVVPRLRVYWRGMRARPPRTPRHLGRLPEARTVEVDEEPSAVLARTAALLRARHYRVDLSADSVAAEKGFLREAGNLLFHFSVLVVLVGFASGQLFGYKGGVITVVGQGFSNTVSQYDDFAPGSLFNADHLPPLSLKVDDFQVRYTTSGPQLGQPVSFSSQVSYRTSPDAPLQHHRLAVNHPLTLHGVSVFLVGHGYAPVVTVRDGRGEVAYRGPVVFLPQDTSFASFGVIKAPDAAPDQLGFEGLFLPTYGFTMARGPFSQFPDTLDPVLSLTPMKGNLGLDSGVPQSVYKLDQRQMSYFPSSDPTRLGPNLRLKLSPGETVRLPGGAGSLRFDGVDKWVKLQVSNSPGTPLALFGVLAAILGLMGSLFIRPRRAWVRATRRGGRTVVEVAGLHRTGGGDLAAEVDDLTEHVAGPRTQTPRNDAPEQEQEQP